MHDDKITTTRRAIFRGVSLTALAAGLAVPALASAAPDDADAELIRLCERLVQLRTAELAALDLADDDPLETDPEWKALAARVRQIDRPLSLAGATAMARCVVRHSELCPDGYIESIDLTR